MKEKIVAVVGPTAVGKTKLSIEIAKSFCGEIISGDSMQVYQGFDIGTAKVTEAETAGVPHYMIDIKKPHETFSAADFTNNVTSYIKQITHHNHLPVIAGGSGLYIQAALYNYNFAENERDEAITEQLTRRLAVEGAAVLHNDLRKIDPQQAKKIHPNNHRRLIRALEIYESTGKTMTAHMAVQMDSPYSPILIGLEMERSLLYERINQRIDMMMDIGLLEEVQTLYENGLEDSQAMRGIGYKEFIPYFKGIQTLDESIEILKRNSRRFAKRQYTWFKNKMNVHWYQISPDSINEKFSIILKDLAGFLEEK